MCLLRRETGISGTTGASIGTGRQEWKFLTEFLKLKDETVLVLSGGAIIVTLFFLCDLGEPSES
jgi:hypothetical protein